MSLIDLRSLQKYTLIAPLMLVMVTGYFACTDKHQFGELREMADGMTDKDMTVHGFVEPYEHFFFPLKETAVRICEIGIGKGGSLIIWRDYFPKAKVYGIDIDDCSDLQSERVKTFIADQADRNQLQSFIDEYGGDYDIILDDGGHRMDQQQISFGFLFKHVKPGGYYVIEDVHTSLYDYYPAYGAEEDEKNTTLSMIHNFNRYSSIRSPYLTSEEMDYLNNNIDYCSLFFRNNTIYSMTCIFKKLTSEKAVSIQEARKRAPFVR